MKLIIKLRNVSFDGLTGKVRFHRFGDPFSTLYSIINIQLSPATETRLRKVTMGTWNKDSTPKLKINTSNLHCQLRCLPVQLNACQASKRRSPRRVVGIALITSPKGTITPSSDPTVAKHVNLRQSQIMMAPGVKNYPC